MQNLATDIFAELLGSVSLCSVNSLESFELCCFLPVRDLTLIHWWLRCKQFKSFGLMIPDLYPSLLSSHFFQWRCHLLLLHFSAIPLTSKTLCSSLSPTLTWDKILVHIPVPTQRYIHAFGEAGDHLGFCASAKAFTVGAIAEAPLNISHWYCFALDGWTIDPSERQFSA